MTVKYDGLLCNCGNTGCWELYVSGRSIAAKVETERHMFKTILNEMADQGMIIDAKAVHQAASCGDPYALQKMKEAGEILGIGLLSCIHVLAVRDIIIGGGLSRAASTLLETAIQRVKMNNRTTRQMDNIRIVKALHPDDAGILGAAFRAKQRIGS